MDRHKISSNRHKGQEVFKSGCEKRKIAKEKARKQEEVIVKTRRMTDFLPSCAPTTSSTLPKDVEENLTISTEVPDTVQPSTHSLDEQETSLQISTEVSDTIPTVQSSKSTLNENSGYDYDIGMWPENMSTENKYIDYWVKTGNLNVQNCDSLLLEKNSFKQFDQKFIRKCNCSLFERKSRNGEVVKRSWLCFSPSKGHVYCFVCKLFSKVKTQFTHGGFCDWKNSFRLIEHETSKAHLNAVIDFSTRSKQVGRIDDQLAQQTEEKVKYWRDVLKRLISVIKFISERGLAFRGENETLGSPNNGNYLGLLELISEYDDFLKNHINQHGNCGSGHTNYLSSTICDEVVELLGKRVFSEIISRIKQSKYYSVSLDSTSDEGHVDQLTLIIRYMEGFTPVERFLTFMPNQGHKATDMFKSLTEFLKKNEIPIEDCRGQSYDNTSSMSGKYRGLQALVLAENSLALWVPCAAHSLNLVAQSAAESCTFAVKFFDFLEELYNFFTASTSRYQKLIECLKSVHHSSNVLVPKRTTTTRWSCRADAVKALVQGYTEIKDTLSFILEDKEETPKTRCSARGLHKQISKLETGLFAALWDDILRQVDKTNLKLQNPSLDINTAVASVKSLKIFILSKRGEFKYYEQKGVETSGRYEYESATQRQRKTNVRLNPLDSPQNTKCDELELTQSDSFRTQKYLPIIDQFIASLEQRLSSYEILSSCFGFLKHLQNLSLDQIKEQAKSLIEVYNFDLDDQLGPELIQFRSFCTEFLEEMSEQDKKALSHERWMYKLLIEKGVKESFPNVEILLRIYLSLMVTNCSGERSFSKLKLIKNRLRTSMKEERLIHLAILSIESDILREISLDDIITSFSDKKSRKVSFKPSN